LFRIQFAIVGYIIGFVIIYEKGYQATGGLIGTVSTKVKGNQMWNGTIWDEIDIVRPFKELDAFFVTSNFIGTFGQKRGICPGTAADAYCNVTYSECPTNAYYQMGISNGTCNFDSSHCWLIAWCPMEVDEVTANYFESVQNFTVFAKVSVKFPDYGISLSNAQGTKLTPGYNLWTIGEMITSSGYSWNDIKAQGMVIAATINFDCDFDKDSSLCAPSFKFERIDLETKLSKGYNFRYASYYWVPDQNVTTGPLPGYREQRDLMKVFGVRVIYLVNGKGGKFYIIPLVLNFGTGLALLGIATVISDFLMLYIMPKHKFYQVYKYEIEEETTPLLESSNQDKN